MRQNLTLSRGCRIGLTFSVLFWALGAPGCKKSSSADQQAAAQQVPSKVPEKRFPLEGEILGINAAEKTLRIKHKAIPDFMPAMTMDFDVSAGDVANAKVGQHIKAELVESGDNYRLEKIWSDDAATTAALESAQNNLVQDTVARGNAAYREIGEQTPDFTLLDQDNRVVESNRFRGKLVMINFIFTRCPVATMCPAAVAKFTAVQREVAAKGIKNVQLISISLDPTYDTPGVLKEYVLQRGIDTSNYTFLTGPDKAIRSLLTQFGILTELKGELLNHTLATLLVDENGKIIHRADGSSWQVSDFVERMQNR